MSYLTGRIRGAGFEIDRVQGKRLTLRFARPVLRSPGISAFRTADRIDRALNLIPRRRRAR